MLSNQRILRLIQPDFLPQLNAFLNSRTAQAATARGELVRTHPFFGPPPGEFADIPRGRLFEHDRIPFVSHPYEWSSAMLHAAGSLTLRLAESALEEGFGIKDATPYNVLFRGPQPVFVDVPSFETRDPRDASWRAYAQFVRTFLLPLAAEKYCGIATHETLAAHRDGLAPEQLNRSLGVFRRWMPPLVSLVTLPKLLGRAGQEESAHRVRLAASPELARYILRGLLRSCRRQLSALAPEPRADSTWSGYLDRKSLYSAEQREQKERFVRKAVDLAARGPVLDVGANEGHYGLLAARAGASVVAIDSDAAVVGSLFRRASAEKLDVLPLVVDLARPTPAMGWRNAENSSFLERCAGRKNSPGKFSLVLLLAVVHHLLVTERIPLDQVLNLAADFSKDLVLIEYVTPEDPMFRRLLRGRDELYSHLTRARFEAATQARFELIQSEQIQGLERWLYLFRRR